MGELLRTLEAHAGLAGVVVSLLALLVSCAAIILAAVSMHLQREHNYKSLTPIATISIGDYEDNIFVSVENTGIGPLIVTSLRVTDGKTTKNDIISWMPDLPQGMVWDDFHTNLPASCVPAGSTVKLMELSGDPDDLQFAKARDNSRRVLQQLDVIVEYKDIYERPMPSAERTLSWFGRHFL
jgi:hypothetical protein